ncbi:hypothetical protein HKW90_01765 [Pseudomonas aeruginosa]|nr:hypothetical protein [Pseudomonas aeruginosa]
MYKEARMRKNQWPDGETMTVDCPNCSVQVDVQIALVREDDMPYRPADCDACGAEFHLLADGTTELTFAHPKQSTAKGLELLKTTFVFDPSEPE